MELNLWGVVMGVVGAVVGFIVVKQMSANLFWGALSVAACGAAGYIIASAMSSG